MCTLPRCVEVLSQSEVFITIQRLVWDLMHASIRSGAVNSPQIINDPNIVIVMQYMSMYDLCLMLGLIIAF